MSKKGPTATPAPSASKAGADLAAFLANPLVGYALGGLVILLGVWWLVKALPQLFSNLEKGGKAGFDLVDRTFSGAVDRVGAAIGSIIGPGSQVQTERDRIDQVQGLVTPGDRALSDLVDSPYEYFRGLIVGPRISN
jgi:hypothetical protein